MDTLKIISKNMGDIYRYIYANGESSRQDIASSLSISLPTLNQNLSKLLQNGYVYEAGNFKSTGGRKATIFSCVADKFFSVGIDITKNHISIVLIDLNLNIIAHSRIRMSYQEDNTYFSTLQSELEKILTAYVSDTSKILGVGISLPVIISSDQKSISYAEVINASADIYYTFCKYLNFPLLLFNDANSAGLAESWRQSGSEPIVYLSLSSSVGGANMNGHSIYTGKHGRGCEFGHMTIVPRGRKCYCNRAGCLDAYCCASILSDFTGGDLYAFFEEVKAGKNKGLINAFDEYMDYLAIAVHNLRMCYDCDVILGGYVGAYMSDHIETFRNKVSELNPFEKDASYIKVCHYKTEASAVGAAVYYIDKFVKELGE